MIRSSPQKTSELIAVLAQFDHEMHQLSTMVPVGVIGQQIPSAINLLQYLHLRQQDLRVIQDQLHEEGLSALSNCETHIHFQLQQVIRNLGGTIAAASNINGSVGSELLNQHAMQLFGIINPDDLPATMVTLDGKWKDDDQKFENLMTHGMQVARINCAHDDEKIWLQLIDQIHKASLKTLLPCKIYMDLSGPKFRVIFAGHHRLADEINISTKSPLFYCEPNFQPTNDLPFITSDILGICNLLQVGNEVWMDDGKIQAVVSQHFDNYVQLAIVKISGKPCLKQHKGIAFPGRDIPVASLTQQDVVDIAFIKKHADLVGYSYVRNAKELAYLQDLLYNNNQKHTPAIIVKIETPQSVTNLPALLLQLMRYQHFGVMIARGDLAVEIGFERLSEIQEEILWICEAAHTPVIWATQVLENMNKTGLASRSEITDAYKAAQSECIMINKGKYPEKVMDTLADLVKRSKRHHQKKRYGLDKLSIACDFFATQRQ